MPAPLAPAPGSPGYKIRERRERLGMTQTELAIASGMKQHQVSRLELNESLPNPEDIRKLARGLGRSTGTVLRYWIGTSNQDSSWFPHMAEPVAA